MADPAAIALSTVAVAAAVAYFAAYLAAAPYWPRSVVKTLPLACGALLAARLGAPGLLVAGMALSAAGDFALSRAGERWFLAGLVAFLAAHLAYIALFLAHASGDWGAARWLAAAGLAAFGAGFLAMIWGRLGGMRGPVAGYVAAILGMGVAALATGNRLALAGALLFVASDCVLALETFVFGDRRRGWTAPVVWTTYVAAQAAILLAFAPL